MNWKRILTASLIAAAVAFLWGFISWTILPWHNPMKFKNSAAVADAVKAGATEHGIYMVPESAESMSDEAGMKRIEDQLQSGPFIWAIVRPAPTSSSMAGPMVLGFLRAFIAAVILSMMLSHLGRDCFRCRVLFCVMAYLLVSINGDAPFWIWFNGPLSNFLIMTADHLIEGLLVGLILARFIRPANKPAQ